MLRKIIAVIGIVALALTIAVGAYALGWNQAKADNPPQLAAKGFGPKNLKKEKGIYYDLGQLQTNLVIAYNNTPPIEHHALSATCINVNRRTSCILRTRTVNIPASVTISADGRNYIATAQP